MIVVLVIIDAGFLLIRRLRLHSQQVVSAVLGGLLMIEVLLLSLRLRPHVLMKTSV